jgi:hypothetical protein
MLNRLGFLNTSDAFTLLKAGLAVYIVSAPTETRAFPLDGAWMDAEGNLHTDCSCILLNIATAHALGKEYNQQCILALYPSPIAKGSVYLLKDIPLNREIALRFAGGYTADNEHLLVAFDDDSRCPFIDGYTEYLPVEVEFIPVK